MGTAIFLVYFQGHVHMYYETFTVDSCLQITTNYRVLGEHEVAICILLQSVVDTCRPVHLATLCLRNLFVVAAS